MAGAAPGRRWERLLVKGRSSLAGGRTGSWYRRQDWLSAGGRTAFWQEAWEKVLAGDRSGPRQEAGAALGRR